MLQRTSAIVASLRRFASLGLVASLLMTVALLSPAPPASAQGGEDAACPTLVEAALEAVDAACADLGRGEACYGHTRIEVTSWDAASELAFSAPADRVSLLDLHTLTTAPLDLDTEEWGVAVLSLQARVEGALPGQAVTFLLMGDATLENAVPPEEPASDDGFGPMQAVYFATGLGRPACHEAPSALVIQSPQGMEVALRINDLDLTIGSTIVVSTTTIPTPEGDVPVMVVALVQGTANILLNGQQIALEQPSWQTPEALPVYAVTLNAEGRVDADSVVVEPPLDVVHPVVEAACLAGLAMLNQPEDNAVCAAPLAPALVAPQSTIPDAAHDPLTGIGAGEACQAAPATTVNRRSGPGTNYPLVGQLTALQAVPLTGYADGTDGYRWWQMDDGSWVRADLVRTAGACAALGPVPAPPPPAVTAAPPPASGSGGTQVGLMWHLMACTYGDEAITNPVSFQWGVGCFDTAESANAHANPAAFQLFVDGVALDMGRLEKRGPEVHAPTCPWGWGYYYPGISLTPGEHTLTLNQTLLDSWEDESGGGQAGTTNTMGCVINVVR